jgi:hypothetical protein
MSDAAEGSLRELKRGINDYLLRRRRRRTARRRLPGRRITLVLGIVLLILLAAFAWSLEWFVPFAGSTSAAYWVNRRIVYAVDYTRGIDILRFHRKHM